MKRLRVGVLFGGRSTEHEVSILSAQSIIAAINQKVDDFTGGAPPADDITLVVAKLLVN